MIKIYLAGFSNIFFFLGGVGGGPVVRVLTPPCVRRCRATCLTCAAVLGSEGIEATVLTLL